MTNEQAYRCFDVVFNGSHHGRDADLICAERIETKCPVSSTRRATPAPTKPVSFGQHPIDPYLDLPRVTVNDLRAFTGLSKASVSNRLWALHQAGLVQVVDTIKGSAKPQKVWAKAA